MSYIHFPRATMAIIVEFFIERDRGSFERSIDQITFGREVYRGLSSPLCAPLNMTIVNIFNFFNPITLI